MQFPLRALVLLPVFVALMLGHYLLLERTRVVELDIPARFWGQLSRDCLLPVTVTACIVGCYATLRREDRSTFTHGPRRVLLWAAVFLVPFVAGLNCAIGVSGGPNSRHAFRMIDIYSVILTHGLDSLLCITVGGHVILTALLGFTAWWTCRSLDTVGASS